MLVFGDKQRAILKDTLEIIILIDNNFDVSNETLQLLRKRLWNDIKEIENDTTLKIMNVKNRNDATGGAKQRRTQNKNNED